MTEAFTHGSTVGGYRIESLLAETTAASVFRARDARLARFAELHVARGPAETDDAQRLLDVARRLQDVDDPHLPVVYDWGVDDGRAYVAVQQIDGARADEAVKTAGGDRALALALVGQLAPAVDALAAAGLCPSPLDPRAVAVVRGSGSAHAYLLALRCDERGDGSTAGATLAQFARDLGLGDDPALVAPPASAEALAARLVGLTPSHAGRRRAKVAIGVGAACVLVAIVLSLALSGGDDKRSPDAPRRAAPAGRVVARIPLGATPLSIAVGKGSVWVATAEGTLLRVDSAEERVVGAPIPLGHTRFNRTVRVGRDALLVATDDSVLRVDPRGRHVTRRTRVGRQLTGLAADGHEVWVAQSQPGSHGQGSSTRLLRLDAKTLRPLGSASAAVGTLVEQVEASDGVAWTADAARGVVTRVGPDGKTSAVKVGFETHGAQLKDGTLWVADRPTDTVVPVKAASLRLPESGIPVPRPVSLAATPDAIWVMSVVGVNREAPAEVFRIDSRTRRVTGRPVAVGVDAAGIAASEDALWVASRGGHSLLKILPADPPPAGQPRPRAEPSELRSGLIAPGTHASPRFRTPLSFTTRRAGWIAADGSDLVTLARIHAPDAEVDISLPRVVFGRGGRPVSPRSARQVVTAIRGNSRLAVAALRSTRFAGHTGWVMTLRLRPSRAALRACPSACEPIVATSDALGAIDRNSPMRLFAVDVGGRVVVATRAGRASAADDREMAATLRSMRLG